MPNSSSSQFAARKKKAHFPPPHGNETGKVPALYSPSQAITLDVDSPPRERRRTRATRPPRHHPCWSRFAASQKLRLRWHVVRRSISAAGSRTALLRPEHQRSLAPDAAPARPRAARHYAPPRRRATSRLALGGAAAARRALDLLLVVPLVDLRGERGAELADAGGEVLDRVAQLVHRAVVAVDERARAAGAALREVLGELWCAARGDGGFFSVVQTSDPCATHVIATTRLLVQLDREPLELALLRLEDRRLRRRVAQPARAVQREERCVAPLERLARLGERREPLGLLLLFSLFSLFSLFWFSLARRRQNAVVVRALVGEWRR